MNGFEEQLATPLGEPGSGKVRYAAAMALYVAGELSAETLEAYRVCCKDDAADPIASLQNPR